MGSPRILCVEDEPDLLETIEEFLSGEGYAVFTAADGAMALGKIHKTEPFDLILCDISMPRMNGFQLLEAVRKNGEYTATPFIFLTAHGQKDDMIHAHRLGCDEYITKPIDLDLLSELVASRLVRKEQVGEHYADAQAAFQKLLLDALSTEMMEPTNAIVVASSFISQSLTEAGDELMERRFSHLYQNAAQQLAMLQQLTTILGQQIPDEGRIADYPCALEEIMDHIARLLRVQAGAAQVTYDYDRSLSMQCDPFLISKAFSGLLSRLPSQPGASGRPQARLRVGWDESGEGLEWELFDNELSAFTQSDHPGVQRGTLRHYEDFRQYSHLFSGRMIASLFLLFVALAHKAELRIRHREGRLISYGVRFPGERVVPMKLAM